MQFFLANSAWLWLLSLAVVPLLVHLFARSNPPKYAFSNTDFLRKIIKKTARVRKPQDWLLLILRTLAVLALLFVFLQPLLTSGGKVKTGKKTTIYLIDRSASMVCKDGASSRFSAACVKALELLDAGAVDEANIVWMDALPDAIFPQPGPNLDFLREALKRSEPRQELGAIGSALGLAFSQLEGVEGSRELVIISDFQSSAWKDYELQLPPDVDVVKIQVGDENTENVAVSELFSSPSEPVVGQDVTLVCRLRNYSATPRRATLYLESGGRRQSQAVEIPAWGEAEANFRTTFTQAGMMEMSASIGEDAFPDDDTRHALVNVREALKIGSVLPIKSANIEDAPSVLSNLAKSLDWLDYQEIGHEALPPKGAVDYVFIHTWDGKNSEQLRELAESGTTLLVHPSLGCSVADCQKLLGLPLSGGEAAIPLDSATAQGVSKSWKAGISTKSNESDPVFAIFKTGEFGNPAAGVFKNRLRLPTDWPEQVSRLIDYQDGVPGIVKVNTSGAPILLWNLGFSPKLSSWSGQTPFVPFMGELLLNSRAKGSRSAVVVLPGSPLTWTPSEGISPESVVLYDENDHKLETEMQMTERGALLTGKLYASPGLYRWKIGDGVAHRQISNFPATESDLRLMDPDLIQGGEVVDTQQLLRRAALGDGIPLWPWLVAAALLFLLLESLVAMWKPTPSKKNRHG